MLENKGELLEIGYGYNMEVIYALVEFGASSFNLELATKATDFNERARQTSIKIRRQIDELSSSQRRVAIWGGTGKAAAFIGQYLVDDVRFPLVVDSDKNKVGSYVPGAGQEIQSSDVLIDSSVDTIIITTQWRATDIVAEINQKGIIYKDILIEHNGELIDFFKDDHPYA